MSANISSTLRRKLLNQKFGGREWKSCHYCGAQVHRTAATLDHIIPVTAGGKHLAENTVVACRLCNEEKADGPYDEFKAKKLPLKRSRGKPQASLPASPTHDGKS